MPTYPAAFVEWFGPSTWKTLHSIAWNYAADENAPTEEEKRTIIDFFRLLEDLLPCPSCRVHYGKYLLATPIDASSRDALTRWLYDLHDDVNRRNHRTSPTYEEHKRDYTGYGVADMKRLSGMSRKRQLTELADPHLGRSPLASSQGEKLVGGGDDLTKALVAGFVVLSGLFAYRTLRRSSGKNSESS